MKYRSPLSSRDRENKARTDALHSFLIPQVAQIPGTVAERSAGREHTQWAHWAQGRFTSPAGKQDATRLLGNSALFEM